MEKLKEGETVMIYVHPSKPDAEIGKAKLIKKVDQGGCLELWNVEFVDRPDRVYTQWILSPKHTPVYESRLEASKDFDLNDWIAKQLK